MLLCYVGYLHNYSDIQSGTEWHFNLSFYVIAV